MASVSETDHIQRLLISELPDSFTSLDGFRIESQQVVVGDGAKRPTLKVELHALKVPELRCSACGSTHIRKWRDYAYTLQDLPTKNCVVELTFVGRRIGCMEKSCKKWTTNVRVTSEIESEYRQITKRLEEWLLRWAAEHYIPEKNCFSRLINYPKLSLYTGMHRNSIRLMFKEWAEKTYPSQKAIAEG